jgi:hypothetical protein
MEPITTRAELQRDPVPVRVASRLPDPKPLRETELHFKNTALARQPREVLRDAIQPASA